MAFSNALASLEVTVVNQFLFTDGSSSLLLIKHYAIAWSDSLSGQSMYQGQGQIAFDNLAHPPALGAVSLVFIQNSKTHNCFEYVQMHKMQRLH